MRVENFLRENNKIVKRIYNALKIILAVLFVLLTTFLGLRYFERQVLYPKKYENIVISNSYRYNLDPAIVYSVIKIESGFNKDAQSEKGAKGLMQITDGTAKYIAKLLGVSEYNLFDAKINIEFGCFYLRYLLNKFNNLETAIIAYNAGEGVVSLWLSKKEYSNNQTTLKTIPYKETREYIKKFNKTFTKYHKLYGNILDKQKNFE